MKRFSPLPAHELVPIDKRLDVATACGFHWCLRCKRVTRPVVDEVHEELPATCEYCGTIHLRWHPPAIPA
jgi:hypothetical protein